MCFNGGNFFYKQFPRVRNERANKIRNFTVYLIDYIPSMHFPPLTFRFSYKFFRRFTIVPNSRFTITIPYTSSSIIVRLIIQFTIPINQTVSIREKLFENNLYFFCEISLIVVDIVIKIIFRIGKFFSVAFLYDVPYEIIVLLSIFYGTISVVAVVGNFLVIWIVKTSHRMHNTTNCFIANLALADIVIGLFAIPFQVSIKSRNNFPYDNV